MPTLPEDVARKEFPLMVSVVPRRFVMVADDEVSVVILAEAILRLLMTRLVSVRFVIVAEVAVNCVMVAELLPKSAM